MLRVSSRQRLVSWDAFDAAAPDADHRHYGDFGFGGADDSYDADADSIADYESCCYETAAPSSRRGSLQGCGWSFDHSERAAAAAASHEEDVLMPALRAAADSVVADDIASPDPPGPPPRQVAVLVPQTPTPSSSAAAAVTAGRKRDRDHYDLPTTLLPTAPLTPTASGASSGMKKVVSFSTLPASSEEEQPQPQRGQGPQLQHLQRPLSQLRTPSDASLCRYMSVNSLCDMATAPSSTAVTLPTLADDVLLLISSYMVPVDVRSLSASSRALRTVVMGKGAHHLWVEMTARRWDLISRLRGRAEAGRRRIEFRDGIDVPVAGVEKKTETNIAESAAAIVAGSGSGQPEEEAERHKVVNASALLGLSAANHPTEIRLDDNVTAGRRDDLRRFRRFEMTTTARRGPHQQQRQEETTPRRSEVVIQFTGRVGTGDRSVLADCPLPKPVGGALVVPPSDALAEPGSNNGGGGGGGGGIMSAGRSYKWSPRLSPLPSPPTALMELLRRSGSTVLSRQGSSSLSASSTDNNKRRGGGRARRPFVSPYVVASSSDRGEEADVVVVDLTPRLVSYYEVTVLSRDVAQEPPAPSSVPPDQRRDGGGGLTAGGATPPSLLRRNRRSTEFGGAEPDGGGLGGGFGGHAEQGGFPAMPPLHLPPAAMAAAMAMPPLPDPNLFPHPRAPAAGEPDNQQPPSSADNNDCVAVGLSTSRFRPSSKMPGWDVHSYGYHGDDGGAFHGAGDMERVFGPKYGVGDTVGCGVDYSSSSSSPSSSSSGESSGGGGGIFFTLNGEFLGYAWTDVPALEEGEDLYPTVGVDTNCPLSVNFGDRPFEFDLTGFTAGHAEEVSGSLGGLLVGRRRRRGAEDGREDGGGGKGGGEEVCGSSSKIDDWGEDGRGVGSLPPLSSSRHGSIMAMRGGGGLRRSRMFRGLSA